MNKQEIYKLLEEKNISYEVTEHIPIFTMEEASSIELPYPSNVAKNLFVRDDKKRNYYLISTKGNRTINLKEFQKEQGTRALSFASENDLMKYLQLTKGSVTPFGLLNDAECKVHFYIGKEFMHEIIGVHPNENDATIWIQTEDLISIIQDHGNKITIF